MTATAEATPQTSASLSSVHVRDFQSIKDVEVQLGSFTVLVGPSNSGKSAFLRALRGIVRNQVSPANVRQGTTKSQIDLIFADGAKIGVDRGKSVSTYRMGSEVFTKSGRAVPPEVAKAIRFPLVEGQDLTFSFQFDRPFLLAEPGSVPAQVLGSLTNVSLLHAAVREANRRRGEVTSKLRVREGDVLSLREQAKAYQDLPVRRGVITQAQDLLSQAQSLEAEQLRLQRALTALKGLHSVLEGLEQISKPPTVDLSKVEQAVVRVKALRSTLRQIDVLQDSLRVKTEYAKSLRSQVVTLDEEYEEYLHQLGVCPTCGQSTTT